MPASLTFIDLSTRYCPLGGGIRTYHRAKIHYFSRQSPQHRYILIYPGRRQKIEFPAANVTVMQLAGLPVEKDPEGYHVFYNIKKLHRVLGECSPDIIETGDPWLSGPLAMALTKWAGLRRPLVTNFYHSDPVRTYLAPWAGKPHSLGWRKPILAWGSRYLIGLQRRFDATLTASMGMREYLESKQVANVHFTPFGVNELFFKTPRKPRPARIVRLLYAGRLDVEKGMDVLLNAREAILQRSDVELTIVGRGAYSARFAEYTHPRYRFAGHVQSPEEMHALMLEHDILLAPGPYETFGLIVLEALAAGMIVVGADSGGTGEILRQCHQPFIFCSGGVASFLTALGKARSSDMQVHSNNAIEVARQYGSWDNAVARMVTVYEGMRA